MSDIEVIQLGLGVGRFNSMQTKICACGCGKEIKNRHSHARYTKKCSERIVIERRRLLNAIRNAKRKIVRCQKRLVNIKYPDLKKEKED